MSSTPTLTKLVSFAEGRQDTWRLPAAFMALLASEMRLSRHGKDDVWGKGLAKVWDGLSLMRFGDRALFAFQGLESILNGRYIESGSSTLENNVRLVSTISMTAFGLCDWAPNLQMVAPEIAPANSDVLGVRSAMLWVTMIICDFVLDFLAIKRLNQQLKATTERAKQVHIMKHLKARYLNMIANACDLPLAVNWSQLDGDMSMYNIGVLGSLGGFVRFYNCWNH